jgi:hypothetical protein
MKIHNFYFICDASPLRIVKIAAPIVLALETGHEGIGQTWIQLCHTLPIGSKNAY